MRIQDFVVLPGFAAAVPSQAMASAEAIRAATMSDADHDDLKALLARLRQEHRDLDVAIEALHTAPGSDLLQVQRLKKRKLLLRDRIIQIEDQITPDIIA
jgi:hypothetical protein